MRFFCQEGKCSLLPEIWWLIIDNEKLRMGFVLDNTLRAGWWMLRTFLWKGQKVVSVFVFFLLLCMYCLFFCLLFVLVVCLRCNKKENNKTKAIFVCGLMFSLCLYVRPRITDFWISKPSKLPWQHFWALHLVSLYLDSIFFSARAYRAAYLDCIFGHQKHVKCLPRQHLCAS